jgi:chorismate dehydratase
MNLTVGFIPYLNMVPFHQGFGPQTIQAAEHAIQFKKVSPRQLGLDAENGRLDAGAMSLVDFFRLSDRFEALGEYGIGVKRAAGSVLLFSKVPLSELQGMCAVTDETSTSFRLLQVLVEKRFNRAGVSYGRVASWDLFDGSAESLLLIGDEALRARQQGVKGYPIVTDLATEWFTWQGTPFVFAHWAVRKDTPEEVKIMLKGYLESSLKSSVLNRASLLDSEGQKRGMAPQEVGSYWDGFLFKLTSEHKNALESFKSLLESVCLSV